MPPKRCAARAAGTRPQGRGGRPAAKAAVARRPAHAAAAAAAAPKTPPRARHTSRGGRRSSRKSPPWTRSRTQKFGDAPWSRTGLPPRERKRPGRGQSRPGRGRGRGGSTAPDTRGDAALAAELQREASGASSDAAIAAELQRQEEALAAAGGSRALAVRGAGSPRRGGSRSPAGKRPCTLLIRRAGGPLAAGSGRGLRKEQQDSQTRSFDKTADGSTTESRTRTREQQLISDKTGDPLHTRTVRRDESVCKRSDGRTVVEETITIKKTSYL